MADRRRFVIRLVAAAAAMAVLFAVARLAGPHLPVKWRELLGVGLSIVIPGIAVAGCFRVDTRLGTLLSLALVPALGVLAWVPPLVVGLTIQLPFGVVAALVALETLVAAAVRLPAPPPAPDLVAVAGLGALSAYFGAQWQSILIGDGLFHAGVIRKMLWVHRISWTNLWPFLDQHSHAGYALPILHAAQAGSVLLTGGDPGDAYTNMVPAFAIFIPLAAYALGCVIGGRAVGVVAGLLIIWMSITGEQSLSVAQQPRYYVSLYVVPVVWALLVAGDPSRVLTSCIVGLLLLIAFVHSTYEVPMLITAVVIAYLRPSMRRPVAIGAVASAVWIGAVYAITILGAPRSPPPYRPNSEFQMFHGHRIAISGSVIFHGRPELLLALAAIAVFLLRTGTPLGWLAAAGAVEYLLVAIPGLLWPLMVVVGEGQAVRYWEEIPWVWMLAAAIVALARASPWVTVPVAAVGSYLIARSYVLPASHATRIAWIGVIVVLGAIVLAWRRRGRPYPAALRMDGAPSALAVAAVLVAVMLGSLWKNWDAVMSAARYGRGQPVVTDRPTPAALEFFRTGDRRLSVVLAAYYANHANWFAGMSYELVGEAGVYTVAMSHYHTQADPKDEPGRRRLAVDRFLDPRVSNRERNATIDRYHVQFVTVQRTAPPLLIRKLDGNPRLRRVFADPPSVPGYAPLIVWKVG
ncbi:MAG: hypothetical protein ACTHNU_08260 [Gaiellales bacterium]